MAALGTTLVTLRDLASREGFDGKIQPVVELLSKMNPILRYGLFKEGNMPTGEKTTVRTGLPAVSWRLINQGVVPTKGSTAQVEFKAGFMESWSQIDQSLVALANDPGEFILSESVSHIEAMAQEFESTFFYGTAAAPEEFVGLAAHYSDTTAGNGQNVLDAGGTDATDNTSIWFLSFGPDLFCMYPRGTSAGITRDNKGVMTIQNFGGTTGALLDCHVEKFGMGAGVALRDWRRAVRIASIDISALSAQSSDADLLFYMVKAYHRLRSTVGVNNTMIVMNPSVAEYLEHQRNARLSGGGGVTVQNIDGIDQMSFKGIPIYVSDNLINTEAPV